MPAPAAADDVPATLPAGQRGHPGYDPTGIRTDAFTIFPSVTIGARYDSNVLATAEPISDWALVTTPEILFVSERGQSRYALEIGARHHAYRDHDSENRTDAHALFRLGRPVMEGLLWEATFEAARRHIPREDSFSVTTAAEAIPFTDLTAETFLTRTFNRFGVTVGGRIRDLSHEDVPSTGGGTLDQSFRDGTIMTVTLKPFHDISPGQRAYLRIDLSKRDHDGEGPLNRDAQGFDARAGIALAASPTLRGSADIGLLSYDYDNPLIPSVNGLSGQARLTWLMTPQMTLTVFADRAIAEMAAPDHEGRLDVSAGAHLDYEILRNLILSLEGTYTSEDFVGTSRANDLVRLSSKLAYLVNSTITLGLNYSYLQREANSPTQDFEKHVVTFNVTAQR